MERIDYQKLKELAFRPLAPGCEGKTLNQLKEESYNRSQGNLTDYDCPQCRNRGNFLRLREDDSLYFQDCGCMKIRQSIRLMKRSGLESMIRQGTFDRFETKAPWQAKAKEVAQDYAAEPTGWLLAAGQSGSGKTHLCTAVCRELLYRGLEVRYFAWREEIEGLKDFAKGDRRREEAMEHWKQAPVLYIDDLFKNGAGADGRVRPTAMDVGIAFQILGYRYLKNLPTVLSTELTPDELVAIDEATGSRILERCGNHIIVIQRDMRKNHRLNRG